MKGDTIAYREGYKYQLAEDYSVQLPFHPIQDISTRFVKFTADGMLTIRQDYAWDGPSGPTLDTPDGMRGSLVHDALYQLIRDGLLDRLSYRPEADSEFHTILLEDGMLPARAAAWYRGVAIFGDPSCSPASQKPVLRAPLPPHPQSTFPAGSTD